MNKLLRNIKFNHVFWVFFYFFLFCLLLHGSFNYLDPDFGWHIQVGQEIAQSRSVPSANYYNYTFTGDWVDHEWLSNLLVYLVYNNYGYLAVVGAFALLVILVLVLLNIRVRLISPQTPVLVIAFFQLLGLIASAPHLGVRIQEAGLLFLLLLLWIIDDYNKRRHWSVLLFLLPLLYLWACLHASFLIGFFLLGAFLAVKTGEKALARYCPLSFIDFSFLLKTKEILIFSGASLLALIATLFTPYKLSLYSFLSGYQGSFYQTHIQEWLSQFSFPFKYWQLLYLALAVLALIFYIYYSRSKTDRRFRINLWALFILVLFIGLSFKSRRHLPLMFVATLPFLLEIYSNIFFRQAKSKISPLNYWLKFYLLSCLLLVSVLQIVQTKPTADPFRDFCNTYPCAAAKFLASHQQYDSLNLFNHYAWGGYLIWNLPARRLFIDGRLPQISYAGHTFLEEYLDFFSSSQVIAEKLEKYDIRLILLPAKDQDLAAKRWEKFIFNIKDKELAAHNHLRDYLLASKDWQPIYYDTTAVIYLKKD